MTATTHDVLNRPRFTSAEATPKTPRAAPRRAPSILPETTTVVVGGVDPQVLAADGSLLRVTWALPYHAELSPGDTLQVLRRGERCYAIGVLRVSKPLVLLMSEVAELRGFRLLLKGDVGLKLLAPDVRMKARSVINDATAITERVGDVTRRVLLSLKVRARNARMIVANEYHTRAKSRRGVAAEAHRLDGDLVQFGQ